MVMTRSKRPRDPGAGGARPAESSIERVLRAEQAADAEVQDTQREAEAMVEQARADAREVLHKADRRITWVRARCRKLVAEAVAEVARREHGEAARVERWQHDAERQHLAVERVARWLTGGEP